jgi:hypothetical protein
MNDVDSVTTGEEALNAFRVLLRRIEPRLGETTIAWETSVVEDLMFDSIRFVDLVAALEQVFGLEEFPFQVWYDEQSQQLPPRFTLRSLARAVVNAKAEAR